MAWPLLWDARFSSFFLPRCGHNLAARVWPRTKEEEGNRLSGLVTTIFSTASKGHHDWLHALFPAIFRFSSSASPSWQVLNEVFVYRTSINFFILLAGPASSTRRYEAVSLRMRKKEGRRHYHNSGMIMFMQLACTKKKEEKRKKPSKSPLLQMRDRRRIGGHKREIGGGMSSM